ncbi:MAG: PaaI family thioesterase [Pseudomonadota bacterium]
MADETMTIETLQALITRAPFHQWLDLKVTDIGDGEITVTSTWREEFVVNPEGRYTHGGILATLIDAIADYAIAAKLGKPVPTIDMRVDYHRAAMPGNLTVKGKIVKLGGQFSTAEAEVFDGDGKLLASGRGTYFTGLLKK